MADSDFLLPMEEYKRNIDPVDNSIHQTAIYLATMTNTSVERAIEFIKLKMENRTKEKNCFTQLRNPNVHFYERQDNGDTHLAEPIPLTQYIRDVIKNDWILAPTFTVYYNVHQKQSLIGLYTNKKKSIRKKTKKLAQSFKASGDLDNHTRYNLQQLAEKLKGNSVSGAFVAGGSPINNPTCHSTLTSTVRSGISLANASNERILAGNRHYRNGKVAFQNLIALTTTGKFDLIEKTIVKYDLYRPTVEDVVDVIHKSMRYYTNDTLIYNDVRAYVSKLSSAQIAAFVYTADLYQLAEHNENFIKEFLMTLSAKLKDTQPLSPNEFANLDEAITNLAHQICSEEVKGKGKKYNDMEKDGTLAFLSGTSKNIMSTISKYKDFIEAFFLSPHTCSSIAYIMGMMREVVVVSDTDSTCFATDTWVERYYGRFFITPETFALSAAVSFIATQSIAHNLAIFSANLGVAKHHMGLIACKPEWVWSVFMLTSVAKHYAALAIMQESNMFKEPELECKGVHMKSSSAPAIINEESKAYLISTLERIADNELISGREALIHIADKERAIEASLLKGELTFYRKDKINNKEGYANPENSKYDNHLMWVEVFCPKYGSIEDPPYNVIRVPTTTQSPTQAKFWLDNMKDTEMAERFRTWMKKKNKAYFGTFYIPTMYVQSYGIPEEIIPIIDVKRIQMDITKAYRLQLSGLNIYPKHDWLVSEHGY